MVNGNLKKKTTRINVTISTELHELLKELARLTGKSTAHMPAYLLEESKPTFQALINAFTTARDDEAMALKLLTENVESAMVKAAKVITHD